MRPLLVSLCPRTQDNFYAATGGPFWTGELYGWGDPTSSDPCLSLRWTGVVCTTNSIISINLSGRNLAGDVSALTLLDIPSLTNLDVSRGCPLVTAHPAGHHRTGL
jgi:hypothetical protein